MIKLSLTTAVSLLGFASTSWAEAPRVATDIAPVHGLVARVMQDISTPDLVVPAGASPHNHSMRPSEAMALAQADLVFWMGEPLTPWLQGAITELAGQARVVELLEHEATMVLPFREGVGFEPHSHDHAGAPSDDHGHDHDHDTHADHGDHDHAEDHGEHDHDHEHDHAEAHSKDHSDADHADHAGHDHSGADPHAWLSPENAQAWLGVIAGELSALDPDNAAVYAANAAAGQAEIQAVADQISANLTGGGFVVFHDAYQYFEQGFDIQAVGAIALSDASDPSPARIAEIQQLVKDHGVTCVFSEPQFNPDLVATVMEGSAAKTVVIDPLGTGLPLGAEFYPALLQKLGDAMAACQ